MSASHQHGKQRHDHEEGVFDPSCDEERDVLRAALASYFLFRRAAHWTFTHRRRRNFYSLPTEKQNVLRAIGWPGNLDRVDMAIEANAHFAECLLRSGSHSFGIDYHDAEQWKDLATPGDLDKARSTIKQFLRDWSEAGEVERDMTYGPILGAVDRLFGMITPRCDVKILVPGAGLGRLAFDLAREGFATEGNEFSFHQLIASNFILNHTNSADEYTLYPFCHGFSHHRSHNYHLRDITVPDVHPGTVLNTYLQFTTQPDTYGHRPGGPKTYRYKPSQYFSMSAGEFVASYNTPEAHETFDCVATCFFIDTARNFLDYLETIRNVLREGGAWVNHGPLLWHFEGSDATESKDAEDTRRKYGDLRDFDQIQADVEDAEIPQLPDYSDGYQQTPFGSNRSSQTRIGSGGSSAGAANESPTRIPLAADAAPSDDEGGVAIGDEEVVTSTMAETRSSRGYPFSSVGSASNFAADSIHRTSVSSARSNRSESGSANNHVDPNSSLGGGGPAGTPNRSQAGSNNHNSQHSHHSHDDGNKEWNGSLEFSLEDVIRLIDLYGFEIIERKTTEPSGYINDVKSMGRYIYESEFWIAVKRPQAADVVEKSLKKFNTGDQTENEHNLINEGNMMEGRQGEYFIQLDDEGVRTPGQEVIGGEQESGQAST
ncbi:hypothetical protein TWF730_010464 [Orbilia blumenaviensis]|uniref:carnosine N-methyltransferase n=1 Tax=Orbilia blumenaviensis TaxID=1796055 RepID=A0AAV9URT2_9PEZI